MNHRSPSSKLVTPRERQKTERINAILNTAETLFAQNGYFNTSIKNIAETHGYAVGALYKYFNSKEELYGTLIFQHLDALEQLILTTKAENCSAKMKISHLTHSLLNYFDTHQAFFKIWFQETRGFQWTIKDQLSSGILKKIHAFELHIEAIFTLAQKQNALIKGLAPQTCAIAFSGMINSFFARYIENQEKKPLLSESIDTLVQCWFTSSVSQKKQKGTHHKP